MPDELRNRMADETNVPTELVDSVIDAYRSGIDPRSFDEISVFQYKSVSNN